MVLQYPRDTPHAQAAQWTFDYALSKINCPESVCQQMRTARAAIKDSNGKTDLSKLRKILGDWSIAAHSKNTERRLPTTWTWIRTAVQRRAKWSSPAMAVRSPSAPDPSQPLHADAPPTRPRSSQRTVHQSHVRQAYELLPSRPMGSTLRSSFPRATSTRHPSPTTRAASSRASRSPSWSTRPSSD